MRLLLKRVRLVGEAARARRLRTDARYDSDEQLGGNGLAMVIVKTVKVGAHAVNKEICVQGGRWNKFSEFMQHFVISVRREDSCPCISEKL
ncbi:unnamed protein product [Haemonchus placei]|uniref:Uncharacterized protein n=1 Tax=Haemonchus placei TaxID=6290 RepID=A0A0N4W114_HAEPC|nr:unnamed protein product [Haemonchus placei]